MDVNTSPVADPTQKNSANEAMEALITAAVQAAVQKSIDPIHARMTRFEKASKAVIEPPPQVEGDELDDQKTKIIVTPKKSAEVKALEARLKSMEDRDKEREAKSLKTAKDATLETLANKIGIDPERMEDFFLHVDKHYGGKIGFEKDSNAVVYRDGEDEDSVPLGSWITSMAAEKKFDKYKPSPVTPKSGPKHDSKNGAGTKSMSKSEYRQAMLDGVQGLDKVMQLSD